MNQIKIPKKCAQCGSEQVRLKRSWPKVAAGVLIVLVSCALAIPTLGVSLIFMIWGIFLVRQNPTCAECGWVPVDARA